jgi:hypothetical protein
LISLALVSCQRRDSLICSSFEALFCDSSSAFVGIKAAYDYLSDSDQSTRITSRCSVLATFLSWQLSLEFEFGVEPSLIYAYINLIKQLSQCNCVATGSLDLVCEFIRSILTTYGLSEVKVVLSLVELMFLSAEASSRKQRYLACSPVSSQLLVECAQTCLLKCFIPNQVDATSSQSDFTSSEDSESSNESSGSVNSTGVRDSSANPSFHQKMLLCTSEPVRANLLMYLLSSAETMMRMIRGKLPGLGISSSSLTLESLFNSLFFPAYSFHSVSFLIDCLLAAVQAPSTVSSTSLASLPSEAPPTNLLLSALVCPWPSKRTSNLVSRLLRCIFSYLNSLAALLSCLKSAVEKATDSSALVDGSLVSGHLPASSLDSAVRPSVFVSNSIVGGFCDPQFRDLCKWRFPAAFSHMSCKCPKCCSDSPVSVDALLGYSQTAQTLSEKPILPVSISCCQPHLASAYSKGLIFFALSWAFGSTLPRISQWVLRHKRYLSSSRTPLLASTLLKSRALFASLLSAVNEVPQSDSSQDHAHYNSHSESSPENHGDATDAKRRKRDGNQHFSSKYVCGQYCISVRNLLNCINPSVDASVGINVSAQGIASENESDDSENDLKLAFQLLASRNQRGKSVDDTIQTSTLVIALNNSKKPISSQIML